jgi:hypothetical protein
MIFICYRRNDSQGFAEQVYDALNKQRRFRNKVFRDIGGIEPGVDFSATIREALANCVVLIALFGPLWLELLKPAEGGPPENGEGTDDSQAAEGEEDFVLLEIELALARGIRVIPVLVGGARMPDKQRLPDSLKKLGALQWLELSPRHRRDDMRLLTRVVKKAVIKASRDKSDASLRNLLGKLERAWGRARGPLWRWLVQGLKAAPFVVPTLLVPNAFIIGALTQWLASLYRQWGRADYIITDPATYVQLALIQSAVVFAYSGIWLAAYRRLRRRREAKGTATGADEPQNTPRTG